MSDTTAQWNELAKRLYPELQALRRANPEMDGVLDKQERLEDPVTAHRMRLDGYAEARALIHEAKEALGHADTRDVALLMLDRAQDLLRPEPK